MIFNTMTGYEQTFYERLPKLLYEISNSLDRLASAVERLEKKLDEKSENEQK